MNEILIHPCTVCLRRYRNKDEAKCKACAARVAYAAGKASVPPYPGRAVAPARVAAITKRLEAQEPRKAQEPHEPQERPEDAAHPLTAPAQAGEEDGKCSHCGLSKPRAAFYKDKRAKSGRKCICKVCEKLQKKTIREKKKMKKKLETKLETNLEKSGPDAAVTAPAAAVSATSFFDWVREESRPKTLPLPDITPGRQQLRECDGVYDDAHVVMLDFGGHNALLKRLEAQAREELRSLSSHIIYICKIHAHFAKSMFSTPLTPPATPAEKMEVPNVR